MKKLFLMFTALSLAVYLCGCGGVLVQKESVCSTATDDSLVCKYVKNPEAADVLLRLATTS